jgi:hypothetical protein
MKASRAFVVNRLRLCARVIEEEDGDLLVRLLTHIDTAVNPIRRLVPVRLPSGDIKVIALATISVFDGECIASEDHRHPMKWITVPRHRLAGREAQPTDERCSTLEESFLCH